MKLVTITAGRVIGLFSFKTDLFRNKIKRFEGNRNGSIYSQIPILLNEKETEKILKKVNISENKNYFKRQQDFFLLLFST